MKFLVFVTPPSIYQFALIYQTFISSLPSTTKVNMNMSPEDIMEEYNFKPLIKMVVS